MELKLAFNTTAGRPAPAPSCSKVHLISSTPLLRRVQTGPNPRSRVGNLECGLGQSGGVEYILLVKSFGRESAGKKTLAFVVLWLLLALFSAFFGGGIIRDIVARCSDLTKIVVAWLLILHE